MCISHNSGGQHAWVLLRAQGHLASPFVTRVFIPSWDSTLRISSTAITSQSLQITSHWGLGVQYMAMWGCEAFIPQQMVWRHCDKIIPPVSSALHLLPPSLALNTADRCYFSSLLFFSACFHGTPLCLFISLGLRFEICFPRCLETLVTHHPELPVGCEMVTWDCSCMRL